MALDLQSLARLMVEKKGSDLHIRSNGPTYIRSNGELGPLEGVSFTGPEVEAMALGSMTPRAKRIFEEKQETDYSFAIEGVGRFRVNAFRQRTFMTMAIRFISPRIPSLEDLRLPVETMRKICGNSRGMVLVTGITGSGKSSTLAAMIGHINQSRADHIVTIEDPIEFVHKDVKSLISQRELGTDTTTYVDALRAAMRQDPDVILMGEMRDIETVSAAMTAAETGHLVFGTLHTTDAQQTISRIVDLYPPHQQTQARLTLADTLKAVVSQRLLASTKGGRVPAVEILVVTAHVKKLIEENKLGDVVDAMKKGSFYGMQTFNQSLVKIFQAGLASEEDILANATNPDDVKMAMRGIEAEGGAKI